MEKVSDLGASLLLAGVIEEENYVEWKGAWSLLKGMKVLKEPEEGCLAVFYNLKTKGQGNRNKKPKRRVHSIGCVHSLHPPEMFYPINYGDVLVFEYIPVEEIRKRFPAMDYRKPNHPSSRYSRHDYSQGNPQPSPGCNRHGRK